MSDKEQSNQSDQIIDLIVSSFSYHKFEVLFMYKKQTNAGSIVNKERFTSRPSH